VSDVAIVHDYITQRGGAERVVLAMARAFPGAPVYTTLYDPPATFPDFRDLDVRTTWLDRVTPFRRYHRLAFPLLAPVVSTWNVDADVLLCSSSGWAHAVRTSGRKLVYCYAPARWIYQRDRYAGDHRVVRAALRAVAPPLRRWDVRAAKTADRYVVISNAVAAAVAEHYGIEPEVLPPPITIVVDGPTEQVAGVVPGALLCVSRLLSYKNVDAVVQAFAALPGEQLVVVGEGPERRRLRADAPPNVRFVGTVDDAELRWLYRSCSGLVAAAYEDFGLTPLEAAAHGRPSAVLRAGGYLDTVLEDDTGVMFAVPTPAAVADAVRRLRATQWDAARLRAHAARFSEARYATRLQELVATLGA
jgi:glycosyltransferase involved in cell wall biosynthesis